MSSFSYSASSSSPSQLALSAATRCPRRPRRILASQEAQELLVLGDVDAHLGHKRERTASAAFHSARPASNSLASARLPTKLSSTTKTLPRRARARPPPRQDLGHRLVARVAAVHDDDVAELATEGTAPGELDRQNAVPVGLEKVEPRPGVSRAGGSSPPAGTPPGSPRPRSLGGTEARCTPPPPKRTSHLARHSSGTECGIRATDRHSLPRRRKPRSARGSAASGSCSQ